jgi:hypothetical protein
MTSKKGKPSARLDRSFHIRLVLRTFPAVLRRKLRQQLRQRQQLRLRLRL